MKSSLSPLLPLLAVLLLAQMTTGEDFLRSDLRNALTTLAQLIRAVADKLERHELRERQLGEQLRKTQQAQDKRQRSADTQLTNMGIVITRVDERLRQVEAVVLQSDEQTRERLQQLAEGQEALRRQVQDCQLTSENSLGKAGGGGGAEGAEALATALAARLDRVAGALEKGSRADAEGARAPAAAMAAAEGRFRALASDTERLLARYESRLEGKKASEPDWHSLFLAALEAQGGALREVRASAEEAAGALRRVAAREDVAAAANETLAALEKARAQLSADGDKATQRLERVVGEARAAAAAAHDEAMQALTDAAEQADVQADRSRDTYEQLYKQVMELRSAEKVQIQTADNVMDTKRRIEYGVHQILLVGDLVKANVKELNTTLNKRFGHISETILQHQTGALTNLSAKIEEEISQVWRQIGIMYQQLTASATALDRLQAQTDSYVNGSVAAMDSMESKVGMITNRMHEVDDNLNYLLGRLSLFSSEFSQVRSGLGEALDNIRTTFVQAQESIRNVGPGPNPIPTTQPPPPPVLPFELPPE